ncbi:MAG: hypothetical protein IPO21_01980 [Bacteroidales bacterium]|nr:hypothetical protein [Bacteroidales bacterium]
MKNKDIDRQKWDYCIKNAFNASIEGFSWYLDCVCEKWDALVSEDYMKVMPLPFKSKYRMYSILNPFFLNYGGVYSINKLNQDIVNSFIQTIPAKFKQVDINLNRYNKVGAKDFKTVKLHNYLMDLIRSYPDIHNDYKNSFQEKISIAENQKFIIKRKIEFGTFLLFLENTNEYITILKKANLKSLFIKLVELLLINRLAEIRGIYTVDNVLVSAGIIISFQNNVSFFLLESNSKGKEFFADALLLDETIRELSGRNLILDFSSVNNKRTNQLYQEMSIFKAEYSRIKKKSFLNILGS